MLACICRKYGVPAAIAEAGYNLIDALSRYQYDADCELFEKIIFGDLCEETYYDQIDMMDGFVEECKKFDKKKNGKKGGRLGGTLKRHEFVRFRINNDEFLINNDGLCIANDGLWQ